ncbi:MAG: formyltransferase family protein [Nitrospirota bacterium]
MNIVFFTQEDPFYVKTFFKEFLQRFPFREEIKALVLSRPMGKKSLIALARQMYSFYGGADFLRMGARYAFLKAMGTCAEWIPHDHEKAFTVKQLAHAYGLPVLERSDLNSTAFHDSMQQLHPDLFISIACPIIFRPDLIKIPQLGCINIHNAPLPRYRGMLPNFWQLYHGEKETGITIHEINAGIDTGDIILQTKLPVVPGESLHELILKTKQKGATHMVNVIQDYREGRIKTRPMQGEGSYFSFPTSADVAVFKRLGNRLV